MSPAKKIGAKHHVGLAVVSLIALLSSSLMASEFTSTIPMNEKGAATFYVAGNIGGYGDVEFMVDTGSGYMTINEHALATLMEQGSAHYIKDLAGIMADGTRKIIPVYRVEKVTIGGRCTFHDIEAAVFPNKTRMLLGLSALRQVAPFVFSMDPPELIVSGCLAAS